MTECSFHYHPPPIPIPSYIITSTSFIHIHPLLCFALLALPISPLFFKLFLCNNSIKATKNMDSPSFHVSKLTNEIFSILENKFLFETLNFSLEEDLQKKKNCPGKVRILSIDGRGSTQGILAAKSLSHLEKCLQEKSGNPDARIADFFDVAAGSGVGGILAALLFTKEGGRPMFTADEALNFLVQNRQKLVSSVSSCKGLFHRMFRSAKAKVAEKLFRQTFGESTLKNTLKPVLIPCYDLSTGAPFLFSRADALETDEYDFSMREVCMATSTVDNNRAFEMRSLDKRTKIVAVDGGVAMNNPTAAAITHVLNNKQEFPFCDGVEDLLVVSLGNGESNSVGGRDMILSTAGFVSIAGEASSDMIDQSVSMAFGEFRTANYVRIQANGPTISSIRDGKNHSRMVEEMLKQRNVESVLFKGKKLAEKTNLEKLELFAGELIKENENRKLSVLPTVLLKQVSPRSSSATVSSTISSSCSSF